MPFLTDKLNKVYNTAVKHSESIDMSTLTELWDQICIVSFREAPQLKTRSCKCIRKPRRTLIRFCPAKSPSLRIRVCAVDVGLRVRGDTDSSVFGSPC